MKSAISESMKEPNGCVRLLLATEAYGMGADAPNVRHVIHIGPPSSIESKYTTQSFCKTNMNN